MGPNDGVLAFDTPFSLPRRTWGFVSEVAGSGIAVPGNRMRFGRRAAAGGNAGATAMRTDARSRIGPLDHRLGNDRGDSRPNVDVAGRFENLVTGRHCEFESSRELLDSIASDLEAGRPAVLDGTDK